jgi:hypothetical protein
MIYRAYTNRHKVELKDLHALEWFSLFCVALLESALSWVSVGANCYLLYTKKESFKFIADKERLSFKEEIKWLRKVNEDLIKENNKC